MGKISKLNPLPFHIGGKPAPTERVYRTMRGAIGTDAAGRELAGPEGGIEDTWRLAKARVCAREAQRVELAAEQFYPHRATVALGDLEDELRVPREATDVERQAAVKGAYTRQLEAVIPSIRNYLQSVDPNIDVVTWDHDDTVITRHGKYLGQRPAYSGEFYLFQSTGRWSQLLPNFSSHFVLVVVWAGLGASPPPTAKRNLVVDHLDEVLPAWVDWRIVNSVGFYLDGFNDSRLDLTAFS